MPNRDFEHVYIVQDGTIPSDWIINELEKRGAYNEHNVSGNTKGYTDMDGEVKHCVYYIENKINYHTGVSKPIIMRCWSGDLDKKIKDFDKYKQLFYLAVSK